ncbi:MAG: mandelate racemase/muconate lactonizing enzyme family protein [Paracoccaceae bacterium]
MKIRSLRATPVNIPFTAPYRFSYGATASLTKTVIELETEDGVTGLGECADGDRAADVVQAGERIAGLDLRDLNTIRARLLPAIAYSPWANVLAARRVFAGIEIAAWDARARTEGVPLALLLGGRVRDRIAQTEYFAWRLPGPSEAGEATPLDIARRAGLMIERHGARIFEGKVATVSMDAEVTMLRELRAAIGDRELRLDANGAYTVPAAREAIRRFSPFAPTWFEEPCESYEEMAALRPHTDLSFSAHAVDLPKAARLGAPDAIVTNLNELGGIAAATAFIRAAESFNVGFRFHSGETGIGTAAYLQVSAALEPVRDASQSIARWYADDVIEGGPITPRDGFAAVPEGPGLGVTLDRTALARCHARYLAEGPFPGAGGAGYADRFRKL